MKRFMTLMLALAFLTGSIAMAQEQKEEQTKTAKKKKKTPKKKKAPKQTEQKQ